MTDPLVTAGEVARRSYGKLVAFLAARSRDVAAAEDALSDAFAKALTEWPRNGTPANPEAWLLTVARRKLIDGARRARPFELPPAAESLDFPDQRLALLFVCAHPAIDASIRAPLMLQTILGLEAATIASAFLVSPAAMCKRLGRAKEKIRGAGIPFRLPEREELAGRLEAVLDAIYAAFTADWSDASEPLFLAHLLTELLPGEAEALGLLALVLHIEARRPARRNMAGEYVPLSEQDQSQWNAAMIARAEGLLHQAGAMGSIGRYQLEAAIQSAHVHRCRTGVANWPHILLLYDALPRTPVVAVNRAIAVAEIDGAEAGVAVLDGINDPRLAEYQPYWAARAELLARAGRVAEAERAYGVAIGLEKDPAVRRFLQGRLTSTSGRRSGGSEDRRST